MFIGHFAIGFAAKKVAPKTSLGTLLLGGVAYSRGRDRRAAVAVEAALFGGGVWLYATSTRARDRVGRWGTAALVAFLALIYAMNVASPPPSDADAVAWAGLVAWLLPLWGWWVDRHREPVAA